VAALGLAAGGCALVSGLSDLDVGPETTVDASVDRLTADATKPETSTDAGIDSFVIDASDAGDGSDGAPPCGPVLADAAVIQSTCSSFNPVFNTGALPTGDYSLIQARVYLNTCSGFTSFPASGQLTISGGDAGTYRLDERLVLNGTTTIRSYSAVVKGNAVDVKLLCGPAIGVTSWGLNVSSGGGGGGKATVSFFKDDFITKQRFFWELP
jgi:hypothetical protein